MRSLAILLLVSLQLGDLASTKLALHHGAVELNPLVRTVGLWQAKLLVIGLVVGYSLLHRSTKVLWVGCGIVGVTVVWNLSLLGR